MWRPRNKDPRLLQKRDFRCTNCGRERPAAKRRSLTKPGHIKTMWCPWCMAETDHVQLGGGEDEATASEDGSEERFHTDNESRERKENYEKGRNTDNQ